MQYRHKTCATSPGPGPIVIINLIIYNNNNKLLQLIDHPGIPGDRALPLCRPGFRRLPAQKPEAEGTEGARGCWNIMLSAMCHVPCPCALF